MKVRRNQVRLIAGQWRGRKLTFPDVDGLRPTGDRIRETLFNWLAPVLPGARCLDLFAGSGALGFEAASRGAAHVVMVEQDSTAFDALQENRILLAADQVEVVRLDALRYLQGPAEPFEIVFLDPPFGSDCLGEVCVRLQDGGWLADHARIYIETTADRSQPAVPAGWTLLRGRQAGQVAYHLFEYDPDRARPVSHPG